MKPRFRQRCIRRKAANQSLRPRRNTHPDLVPTALISMLLCVPGRSRRHPDRTLPAEWALGLPPGRYLQRRPLAEQRHPGSRRGSLLRPEMRLADPLRHPQPSLQTDSRVLNRDTNCRDSSRGLVRDCPSSPVYRLKTGIGHQDRGTPRLGKAAKEQKRGRRGTENRRQHGADQSAARPAAGAVRAKRTAKSRVNWSHDRIRSPPHLPFSGLKSGGTGRRACNNMVSARR